MNEKFFNGAKAVSEKLSLKILTAVFFLFSFAFAARAVVEFKSFSSYTTVTGLITAVINWFLSITAGVTVLLLIIGGIYYLTAFGDEERMRQGKKIITYAVYGLIIVLISYSVVTTVNAIIFN